MISAPDCGYDVRELRIVAARCRLNVLRMLRAGGGGHLGGAMSCIDMVTALYCHTMRHDPKEPRLAARDRFVLSAGHKCMAQYAVLAECGYFDKSELDTYGKLGTRLPGHPDLRKLPGIEANTGSLGHGLSISTGMALGLEADARRSGEKPARVFAMLGDGELPEGSNWEAAAAAAKYGLDNLCAIVDVNGLQISGATKEIMDMEPIAGRFAAFGWSVRRIDGNSMEEILEAFGGLPFEAGKPSMIAAYTVKGKGVPFLEGQLSCHYWKPTPDELSNAENELRRAIAEMGGGDV